MTADENLRASRAWWDLDADNYQGEHGDFLGETDFVWCPEGLREADVQLLGDVRGKQILELGCGAASSSRWLATQDAKPVALDVSAGMLRHASSLNTHSGYRFRLSKPTRPRSRSGRSRSTSSAPLSEPCPSPKTH